MFQEVFKRTVGFFVETIEAFLPTCWDSVGILLCSRVVEHYKEQMSKRGVRAQLRVTPSSILSNCPNALEQPKYSPKSPKAPGLSLLGNSHRIVSGVNVQEG